MLKFMYFLKSLHWFYKCVSVDRLGQSLFTSSWILKFWLNIIYIYIYLYIVDDARLLQLYILLN